MVPSSVLLPPAIPTVPFPPLPHHPPCCRSMPSHLSSIKCKLLSIALTYAVEKRSLLQWWSGRRPIFSWINTRAICLGRLADTEMFVFQGSPLPSLYFSSPLPLTPSLQNPRVKRPHWRMTGVVSPTRPALKSCYDWSAHVEPCATLEHSSHGVWSVGSEFIVVKAQGKKIGNRQKE